MPLYPETHRDGGFLSTNRKRHSYPLSVCLYILDDIVSFAKKILLRLEFVTIFIYSRHTESG